MRILRNFLIGLFLTIAGITALMLLPSKQAAAPMPWEVIIMPDGNSKVFGIHIGTTSYRQAQEKFRVYGKTALFVEEGSPSTVEAFFNSINLGGLSAKLVLNLDVTDFHIDEMMSRALDARLQPSGAHRYELSNEDNATLINAPVTAITYIPTVRLDSEMVRYRFGEANSIEQDNEHPETEIWFYGDLKLSIRMTPGEKTILEYQLH